MSAPSSLDVLVVSPDLPRPASSGFATRVHGLSLELARRHRLSLLSYGPERGADRLEAVGDVFSDVVVVPRREPGTAARRAGQVLAMVTRGPYHARQLRSSVLQEALDRLLARHHFDLVQLESSQLAGLDCRGVAPVVLDEHNIEYELLQRMRRAERSALRRSFNAVEWRKFRRLERRCWDSVAGCAVTSDREQAVLRREAPGTPTVVVPNAVDVEYFTPADASTSGMAVVFVGLLSYRPNLDAARTLVSEVFPAIRRAWPSADLSIVGHGAPGDLASLRGPGVTVHGWVPDVRPILGAAAVFAAPIRVGSGTRLKILEAMAMGRAVVASTVACEGLNVRHGEHLLVADDPDAFVGSVLGLLGDREEAARLGTNARILVAQRYSWRQSAGALEALYRRVVGGTPAGDGASHG